MGKMDLSFYTSVIDQASIAGVGALTLASRGEPTLHPHIADMIRYCKGKFIEKKLNTNATYFTVDIGRAVLESGFNHLIFSCDSHLKDEYESIRKGAKFDVILNNIKQFWMLRNSIDYKHVKIRVSISGVKFLPSQNPIDFKLYWNQFCDDAYLSPAEDRWDTYHNAIHPEITESCIYPWERLYIWHDGTINPCDVDYKSLLSPGKIQDFSSIEEAWRHLSPLRKKHLDGNRSHPVS
jgi:MoaA/NifB/PqqE/SkfB family radical SAM enzyme